MAKSHRVARLLDENPMHISVPVLPRPAKSGLAQRWGNQACDAPFPFPARQAGSACDTTGGSTKARAGGTTGESTARRSNGNTGSGGGATGTSTGLMLADLMGVSMALRKHLGRTSRYQARAPVRSPTGVAGESGYRREQGGSATTPVMATRANSHSPSLSQHLRLFSTKAAGSASGGPQITA